jgi:intracellular multiplication protein IcmL
MSEKLPVTPAPAEKDDRKRRRSSTDRGGAVKVVERNQAVHLILRRLVAVALLATLAAGISVVCMFGIYGRPVPPVYLPVTEDGLLLPLIPLNQPNVDKGGASAYALEALHAVYTYDYINWRDQLNAASLYFSPQGFAQFQSELQNSHILDAVRERHMIVSIKPLGEVAVKQGTNPAGVYTWHVDVPIEVTYTAHGQTANGAADAGNVQKGVATLFISRVPNTINPRGLAVQVIRLKLDT